MGKKRKAARSGNEGSLPKAETIEQRVARLERENARLERENASLKTDREILEKAAAFFVKERA